MTNCTAHLGNSKVIEEVWKQHSMDLNILIFTFKTEPRKFHICFIRYFMILVKPADREDC